MSGTVLTPTGQTLPVPVTLTGSTAFLQSLEQWHLGSASCHIACFGCDREGTPC